MLTGGSRGNKPRSVFMGYTEGILGIIALAAVIKFEMFSCENKFMPGSDEKIPC
jgi:hypothetical protein